MREVTESLHIQRWTWTVATSLVFPRNLFHSHQNDQWFLQVPSIFSPTRPFPYCIIITSLFAHYCLDLFHIYHTAVESCEKRFWSGLGMRLHSTNEIIDWSVMNLLKLMEDAMNKLNNQLAMVCVTVQITVMQFFIPLHWAYVCWPFPSWCWCTLSPVPHPGSHSSTSVSGELDGVAGHSMIHGTKSDCGRPGCFHDEGCTQLQWTHSLAPAWRRKEGFSYQYTFQCNTQWLIT